MTDVHLEQAQLISDIAVLCRLQRGDELLKSKDDEVLDLREQLNRLRDDFDELRGQYAAVTVSGNSKEQHREMTVRYLQQLCSIAFLHDCVQALEEMDEQPSQ